jgi:predicted ATP-binding protein involved in virulence
MKLKELSLSNFRAFEDLELKFDSQTTVIIGHNGAGKTSILDAIAMCMTHLTGNLLSDSAGYDIDAWFVNHDIMNEKNEGFCSAVLQDNVFNEGKEFQIVVKKERNSVGINFEIHPKNSFEGVKSKLKNNQIDSIPIIAYFNVHRTYPSELKVESRKTYNSLLFAYDRSLSLKNPNFKYFEKWFLQQVIEENALKIDSKDFDIELQSLKYIKSCLSTFLSFIEPNTFGNINTKNISNPHPNFLVEAKNFVTVVKKDKEVSMSQLSDGERNVISLVVEIARRLVIANNTDPSKGNGIVLIDEIELHLHPKWQNTIIKALEQTFPNLTFIVTTHSPLVLSSVRKSAIKVLQDYQEIPNDSLPDIYTGTADEVLEDIMDAEENYNPYKAELKEIDKLFNDLKFDLANDKLQKLKVELNSSPRWLEEYETRLDFVRS